LDDPRDYPVKSSDEYNALKEHHNRLKNEYQMTITTKSRWMLIIPII